ncbi:MFS general substrate transporter [Mycena sp. CBHHK59/15]|nr:MFS general substrate transporter [Mycena sp. CBHHK59/15]
MPAYFPAMEMEKQLASKNSDVSSLSRAATPYIFPEWTSPELRRSAERRLVRRLDFRLVPAVFMIYVMNYIDRTAIATARLKGLQQDLKLSGLQYSVVLSILFISYAPAQIPSNMILNKIKRPSIYIGSSVIAWGIASALTGATTNYAEILACRFFIGLPEAVFYPGAVYLLSCWYTKKELAFRSAIFYSGLIVSNGFGALLAAGVLSGMEGTLGIRSWRWLFIIEGSATILLGFVVMWMLPDYPRNTRWINDNERRLAQARLAEDAGEADQDTEADSPFRGLRQAAADPLVSLFALMVLTQQLGRSFGLFFPTLVQTLGYSTTTTLLLTAPPWFLGAFVCWANAWHADKTGERFFHISAWVCGIGLGYIISLCTMSTGWRYFSMFLMTVGDAGSAMSIVWVANSIPRPPAKRAAAIAIVNGVGNLGTLIGTFVWKEEWGPQYHPTMVISLCAIVLSTAFATIIRQLLLRRNSQLDANEMAAVSDANQERVKEAAHLEGISYEQALERRKGFRYLF